MPTERNTRESAAFRAPLYALALLGAVAALPACGEDAAAPTTVDTLCSVPESKCIGQAAATCALAGKAWSYDNCLPGSYCVNGACAPGKCTPESGKCTGGQLIECSGTGNAEASPVDCGSGEVCAAGACLPATCTDGATRCGDPYTLATCAGGTWTASACPAGEICGGAAGSAACEARLCAPGAARCDGEVSYVCDAVGRTETKTTCPSGQICKTGYCQPKVVGVDDLPEADADDGDAAGDTGGTPDVVSDVSDVFIPPLETPGKIIVTVGGVATTFDLNGRADYVFADTNLKISGGSGSKKLEINIAPLDQFGVGHFTDTDGGEVAVVICYYDGGLVADGVHDCPQGFSHGSILYDLTLDQNNGPGSRVKGSFSATLQNAGGANLELTGGTFDVLFK